MIVCTLAAALTVVVLPDPGFSAVDALVRAGAAAARAGRDGRASLDVAPGPYDVAVTKAGFVPARAHVVVGPAGTTLRVPLHDAPAGALRTIGAVSAAERGAFNRAPEPVAVLAREGYRDQGQPGSTAVLAQTPAVTIDRAARGLGQNDAPPVALVRGGTPPETQMLLDGMPVALATTRTLALSALPAFVTQEVEVQPGAAAPLAAIDGAINGSVNVRFAEPLAAWRALPEAGADSRGGSFGDVAAGGALGGRRIGFAVAATANGVPGDVRGADALQRALLVKMRVALSPAATVTATRYGEGDADAFGASRFAFTAAELRTNGAGAGLLARWWRADGRRDGAAAGDPFEVGTADALVGASLEYDRVRGGDLYSAGVSETFGRGTASGAFAVEPGAAERVQTAFVRAVVHPAPRWEAQAAGYLVAASAAAAGARYTASATLGRAGVAYRASERTSLRASAGEGFAPPSLSALAGRSGSFGLPAALTLDVGIEQRVIDSRTTVSADVYAVHAWHRLAEVAQPRPAWIDAGTTTRHGVEFSLARRAPAGIGYLLQAWTAPEPASFAATAGDSASGAAHGYAEVSYHARSGSRISFGATYWGADPALGQPSATLFNANLEIALGARGKLQLDAENLNGAARAGTSEAVPVLLARSAFAPGPRTFRVLLRRAFGRTGSDG